MARKSKYTKEYLQLLVSESRSISDLLRRLGLNPNAGGSSQFIRGKLKVFGIDTSHFLGQGWNKGDIFGLAKRNTIPLEDILRDGVSYASSKLRLRLIKQGILKEECAECGQLSTWNNRRLTLQLDHINGERTDNRLENLRLLCPNCHSQTPTHSGKNRK